MSVSSKWVLLHERRTKPFFYYRKIEAYPRMNWGRPQQTLKELEQNIDISQLIITSAEFGGPIALTRYIPLEETESIKSTSYHQIIRIYSCSGNQISQINVNLQNNKKWKGQDLDYICGMGWTDELQLMVLTFSGEIHCFNLRGKRIEGPWDSGTYFDLKKHFDKKKPLKVYNYKFWGKGCAVWTKTGENDIGHLFVATDLFKTKEPWIEFPTEDIVKIYSMEVIPKEQSNNEMVQVLLSPRGMKTYEKIENEIISKQVKEISTIVVVTKNRYLDLEITQGPFTRMKFSKSGHYIALFTKKGELLVVSSNFSRTFLRYSTNSRCGEQDDPFGGPKQMGKQIS
jgi:hypothetical protein